MRTVVYVCDRCKNTSQRVDKYSLTYDETTGSGRDVHVASSPDLCRSCAEQLNKLYRDFVNGVDDGTKANG